MKRFICLMIFAIGLFVSLPGTSSGSGSPPGQASFVQGPAVDFTAVVVNQEVKVFEVSKVINVDFTVMVSYQGVKVFEVSKVINVNSTAMVNKEGGLIVVSQGLLERQYLYLTQPLKKSADYTNYSTDIRLCYDTGGIRSTNLQNNIVAAGQIKIRADTQG